MKFNGCAVLPQGDPSHTPGVTAGIGSRRIKQFSLNILNKTALAPSQLNKMLHGASFSFLSTSQPRFLSAHPHFNPHLMMFLTFSAPGPAHSSIFPPPTEVMPVIISLHCLKIQS